MAGPLLSVRYDDRALKNLAYQARNLRGGLARIVPPAINRVTAWTRTQIKRQVARQAKIKVGAANKLLRQRKASRAKWSAEVAVENRRIGIAKFVGGRKGRVTASFPSGRSQSYPQHFRATMPTGHKGIFVRARVVRPGQRIRRPARSGPKGTYRTELPIYEQRERLGTVINMDFLKPIQRQGAQRLQQELASKLQYQLQKTRQR